jgi:hypothetical protein
MTSPLAAWKSTIYYYYYYLLDGPGIESRWEAKFSVPVQTDHGAHPASFTMITGSLSRGQSGRGVALTTHPI